MNESSESRPDQDGFGDATPGEAQSEDPPSDPEMIEEDEEEGEVADEDVEADQNSGPSGTAEQIDVDDQRDQAEG